MLGKRFFSCIVIASGIVLMTGCGSMAKHDNVDSAALHIQNLEYEEAAASLDAAEAEGEDPHQLYRVRGILCRSLGDYEGAEAAFLKSLASSDGIVRDMDYDSNYYLADCYLKLGKYTEAIEVYDAILALRKRDKNAYYMRGLARLYSDDHDGAVADFNKSISLSPKDYDMRIMVYKALMEEGYEEEGSEILQSCLNNSDPNMTNYEKGQISYYLGNNADAQSYLELARNERDAQKAPVVRLLGQTGEKQGDYNYAVSVYKTFLAEDPNHADICNQLGLCQVKMGDYESAIASFEEGLKLEDSRYQRALMLNEITAYEYSGNFAQARSLMEKYRKAYPDDRDAEREEIFLSTR